MSSRHKRVFRKRVKDQHVICINCNTLLKFDKGQSRYRRRYPLTNRLQDRKWDPSQKPGISILEGLTETMPELAAGNISQFLSTMCICHECTILLRQVVNYKFRVQNLLVELQQKIGNVTNEMRLETCKEANQTDKVTKCWACQQNFSKDETRFAMHKHIVDELTVKEAIESVLPDECVTLQGTSQKYLMICKSCFKTLNKIITVQCQAESTRQSFVERTNENGLISKIQEQGDDFDTFDDYAHDGKLEESCENNGDGDDMSETIDSAVSEFSQNEFIVDGVTVSVTEKENSYLFEGETESESALVLTGSNTQAGVKRKLEQMDLQTDEMDNSDIGVKETFNDSFVAFVKKENDLVDNSDQKEEKRRKTGVDVLSILQSARSQNEEHGIAKSDEIDNEECKEKRLVIAEENESETLCENVLRKVVYYLQKNLFQQAFKVLQKNSVEFEKEIQKLVMDKILIETSEDSDLETSDWSKLSSLHSEDVTLEKFVEVYRKHLPLLSRVLSCSISGRRQMDFTKIEKKTLLRLLTVMGVIAFERNPKCHVIQCLNSIQMAEDGCTSELYNTFFGLGLCLKEKDTQQLLATPDYATHQVCWDLLKETQEAKGSVVGKRETTEVKDIDEPADNATDDDDIDDSVPEDFAAVCPYWKLPAEEDMSSSDESSASTEWVLYDDSKTPGRAELIRLIFEEAGVPYQECSEPYDDIEIVGGKLQEYPAFGPPVVRKGNLTLTEIPVICRHLGEQFGLCPDSVEDKVHAEQICHTCYDFLHEGTALLETDSEGKLNTRNGDTNPCKERFVNTRVPRFLNFFETALKANSNSSGFFFGNKLSYADLTVFHVLRVTERHFPDSLKRAMDITQLKAFKGRLSVQPKLKAFYESDKYKEYA